MWFVLIINILQYFCIQLRGHAMFSDEGRSLQDETLEYAWLLELQLGKLSGRMTMPQVNGIISLKLELSILYLP